MLKILFLAGLLSVNSLETAGFVFSRSQSDIQSYIQGIAPSLAYNIRIYNDSLSLPVVTRDGIVQVTLTISEIVFSDINVTSNNIQVEIGSPNWINITMSEVSCNAYFRYSEVGFNIAKSGSGISYIPDAQMVFNLELYYDNGTASVAVYPSNITFDPNTVETVSDDLTTKMNKAVTQQITYYLNSVQFAALIPSELTQYLDEYLNSVAQYVIDIPYLDLYMDARVLFSGIDAESNYVSYAVNGTIVSEENPGVTIANLPQLPMRLSTVNQNESQIIISSYTLQTYFSAYANQYNNLNITRFPRSFPITLNANNGYFPEIQAVYPNANLSLSMAIVGSPFIFILDSGMLFRTNIKFTLSVMSNGNSIQLTNYNVMLDYQCTATINRGIVDGNCVKPRMVSLVQVNPNFTISNYNIERFTFDTIYTVFRYGWTSFFFPVIPLNYPRHTHFTINNVVYSTQGNYIGIQYFATYPN